MVVRGYGQGERTYTTGGCEGAVYVEEADCVFELTLGEGRVGGHGYGFCSHAGMSLVGL